MKYSGIEWIGNVPIDWQYRKIGNYFYQVKDKNIDMQESNLLSLSYGSIIRKDINSSDGLLPESFSTYNIVLSGDIVLRMTDLQNDQTSLRTGYVNEQGIITSAYISIRPKDMSVINPKYIQLLLHSFDVNKGFYGMGSGVRQNVTFNDIKKLPIMLPLKEIQDKIIGKLEKILVNINNLVSSTKQSIQELKKYKQSIITEAVTKGLNPNSEMKDSGIKWVGRIPAHWKVSRVKYECINLNHLRKPISAELRKTEKKLYDYYGASGVIDKIDEFNIEDTVLLIAEDGANLVTCNLPLVYRATGRFWVNNHAHILKPNKSNDYDYFYYLLESADYSPYISGSAQPKLTRDKIDNFRIPLPSFEEQTLIAKDLNKKVGKVNKLIVDKERLVMEFENYKKSLIYEYVTGKKEV